MSAAPGPGGLPPVAELTRQIDQDLVDRYAAAADDPNPIHRDTPEAREGPYGRPIAHGMLVLALVSQMMTEAFGERWAATGALSVRWRAPAIPPVRVTATAVPARLEVGRAHYDVRCTAADGELLLDGGASLRLA